MAPRKVTITLDEGTAELARIEPTRRGISVSRLVSELLRNSLHSEQSYELAKKEYLSRPPKRLRARRSRYPSREELHSSQR